MKRIVIGLLFLLLGGFFCNAQDKHKVFVFDSLTKQPNYDRKECCTIHANGDGTFIVNGRTISYRKEMLPILPPGA